MPGHTWLECIDFAGISGDEIESRYLEWANPEAAAKGLKFGEAEGAYEIYRDRSRNRLGNRTVEPSSL